MPWPGARIGTGGVLPGSRRASSSAAVKRSLARRQERRRNQEWHPRGLGDTKSRGADATSIALGEQSGTCLYQPWGFFLRGG